SVGATLKVSSVTLMDDNSYPPPQGGHATDGTLDGQIQIDWLDPAITYDPDGPGSLTFHYDGVYVLAQVDGGRWQYIATVAPGISSYLWTPTQDYTHTFNFELGIGGSYSPSFMGRPGVRPVAKASASPLVGSG